MNEVTQTNQLQNANLLNPAGVQQYTPAVNTTGGQTVAVTPACSSIYQYPQSSIYDPNQKQAASGVNIYIYNPSGYGGPSTNTCYGPYNYSATPQMTYPAATQIVNSNQSNSTDGNQQQVSAAAPMSAYENDKSASSEQKTEENDKQKKNIVPLTNDYIKMLESYLTNSNSNIRRQGIEDLINRFEEDSSRQKDPALTALLNIALQDPNASNRLLAMSPVAADVAAGDKNTLKLLENLTKSDKVYGQEAKTASSALLKAVRKQS